MIDHKFYDDVTAIMDIEINSNFSLHMENNTINIPQMDNPRVAVLFLKFPTLNTKVILFITFNPSAVPTIHTLWSLSLKLTQTVYQLFNSTRSQRTGVCGVTFIKRGWSDREDGAKF